MYPSVELRHGGEVYHVSSGQQTNLFTLCMYEEHSQKETPTAIMSSYPSVSVQVDASANMISVDMPGEATGAANPTVVLQCKQDNFFESGIQYVITRDAQTNVITNLQAVAKSNVSSSHIISRATTESVTWINTASGAMDVSFNFHANPEQRLVFDASNATSLLSSTSGLNQRLGYHILMIATHALSVRQPSLATSVFNLPSLQGFAPIVEKAIVDAVVMALSTQQSQQTILDKIISTNGPIISDQSGLINYTSSLSPLIFSIACNNITLNIQLYTGERKLTLRNIRLRLELVP